MINYLIILLKLLRKCAAIKFYRGVTTKWFDYQVNLFMVFNRYVYDTGFLLVHIIYKSQLGPKSLHFQLKTVFSYSCPCNIFRCVSDYFQIWVQPYIIVSNTLMTNAGLYPHKTSNNFVLLQRLNSSCVARLYLNYFQLD